MKRAVKPDRRQDNLYAGGYTLGFNFLKHTFPCAYPFTPQLTSKMMQRLIYSVVRGCSSAG